jgi:isocitrate dehydrogenase kinase/phosphatase
MKISVGLYGTGAHHIALALIQGFNKHYKLFRETSQEAKIRFQKADWLGVHQAVKERIRFYDDRVDECVERLRHEFEAENLDDNTWQQIKLLYIGLLLNHKQPELAETFFNSVTTKILHRDYFHNDFIFVRPSISTENIESETDPTYRSYYAMDAGLRGAIRQIICDFDWTRPFADLEHDVNHVYHAVRRFLREIPQRDVNFQIQVLGSAFYRNKAAYIIGKAINGATEYPFAILPLPCLLHGRHGGSVRLRPVFAFDFAQQAALRALHHARTRQAGQNHVFPRLHLSPASFRRQIHHGPRHSRPGHAGLHPAVLSLRFQNHQRCVWCLKGNGQGDGQTEIHAGQTGRPGWPDG